MTVHSSNNGKCGKSDHLIFYIVSESKHLRHPQVAGWMIAFYFAQESFINHQKIKNKKMNKVKQLLDGCPLNRHLLEGTIPSGKFNQKNKIFWTTKQERAKATAIRSNKKNKGHKI